MSAAGPSNYETLRIDKSDVKDGLFADETNNQLSYSFKTQDPKTSTVQIEGKTIDFNYFESIYSPMITAQATIVDTGDSVTDKKDRLGTIKDALRIVGDGTEFLTFKIATSNSVLTTKEPMAITGSPLSMDQTQRQILNLPLVSKFIINTTSNPKLGYYGIGTVDDAVKKILQENNLPFLEKNIEKTQTVDKVEGKNATPIDLVFHLCKKCKPIKGAPGFFFYETQEGFNFRSIEGLINDGIAEFKENQNLEEERTYYYSNSQKQDLSTDKMDFNILKMPLIKRDQDLLTSLKSGVYNVRIQTKNLLTGEFTDNIVNLLDKNSSYLGNKPSVIVGQNEQHLENYCKTYTYVLTPGSLDEGVGSQVTNNPATYEPQAHMRYAMLHSQVVDIEIPCNTKLMAGNVIKLMIENVTGGIKQDNKDNEHRSGFYLILHLRHHFDPRHSKTFLTLVRDTYGLYTSTK